jgi:polar amino acid transport system permease protein
VNWNVLVKYWPLFLEGAIVTLRISVFGIVLSILFGALISLIRYYRVPLLSQICRVYIELSRNTPLLVQLVFIYFGLPKLGIVYSGETSAVIGVVFLGASYMAETMRSGLESVDHMQKESALSLGMTKKQAMQYVILPQAIAVAVPAIFANVIFLIKETSVVSIIAVPDLMYVAKDLIGNDYRTNEALFMLVIFYMIIILPITLIAGYAERRMRHA